MKKQPFDSAGVQALQQELYALTDPLLQAEAEEARTDFIPWLMRHFAFTPSQVSYMGTMDAEFSDIAAELVAFHIGHRYPIDLTVSGSPDSGDDDDDDNDDDDDDDDGGPRGKLILFNQSRQASHNRTNGTLSVGYLQVLISYPPGE